MSISRPFSFNRLFCTISLKHCANQTNRRLDSNYGPAMTTNSATATVPIIRILLWTEILVENAYR